MALKLLPEREAESGSSRLFVYGTLRRGFNHPVARLLARHARYLGEGRVKGRLYRIGGYPALVGARRDNEWVKGELYALDRNRWLLRRLDRYEGISAERPATAEYQRVMATVYRNDGSTIEAWAYRFRLPVHRLKRLSSGDFRRERRRPPGVEG